jgi:hypothetical protein
MNLQAVEVQNAVLLWCVAELKLASASLFVSSAPVGYTPYPSHAAACSLHHIRQAATHLLMQQHDQSSTQLCSKWARLRQTNFTSGVQLVTGIILIIGRLMLA